jgi:T5SS/PEP-CTERM-associated repeat protein
MQFTVMTIAVFVLSVQTSAAPIEWIGGVGDWNAPANWANSTVPASSDTPLIANGGTAIASNLTLSLNSGLFGALTNTQSGDGGFVQHGGSSDWGSSLGIVLFGRDQGTTGYLTLDANARFTSSSLILGSKGSAIAEISDGSQVTLNRLNLAGTTRDESRTFTADAQLTVRGQGTFVQVNQPGFASALQIGVNGTGAMTIADGAVVETTSALLASTTSQGSSLTIDGPDSVLRITSGFFDMGRDVLLPDDHPPVGNATLTLRNGGTLDAQSTTMGMLFAEQSFTQGTGTILGNVRSRSGVIDPGELNAFGSLTIVGELDNEVSGLGGTLHFDLGGTDIDLFDRLTVNDLIAGGTLEVDLADGYAPQLNDTFQIITATNLITGDFDFFDLPTLDDGFFFETSIGASTISLTVVPAPSSLLILGCFAAILRRNRISMPEST